MKEVRKLSSKVVDERKEQKVLKEPEEVRELSNEVKERKCKIVYRKGEKEEKDEGK